MAKLMDTQKDKGHDSFVLTKQICKDPWGSTRSIYFLQIKAMFMHVSFEFCIGVLHRGKSIFDRSRLLLLHKQPRADEVYMARVTIQM